MSKLVSDGEKRYTEANLPELQKIYEQRVAEIKGRHAASAQVDILGRFAQYLKMRWEIVRAKREVFGKDNLYLFNPN